MTNPDNIVRVRARNGGRASVYEANGWCQAYGSGILEGTGVVQNTVANMTVLVGGSSSKPDVLIAQNPAGYKIALDLVGQQPVTITAPASNSRISAIVAYTDDLALESTEDTVTGSPASCGLIVVNGSKSASPSAPTDTQIRNAITSDGATGSQASYAIIATITVASNTTTITDALITRNQAGVQSSKIDFTTFSTTVEIPCGTWIDGKTIYKKTVYLGALPNSGTKDVLHHINNIGYICGFSGIAYRPSDDSYFQLSNAPHPTSGLATSINIVISSTKIIVSAGINRSDMTGYCTIYYTKTS